MVSVEGYVKVQMACLIALVVLVAVLTLGNDGGGYREAALCSQQKFYTDFT